MPSPIPAISEDYSDIIVKKQPLNSVYLSQRNNSTDFPVLTCAAALIDGKARTVIGARPGKAMIVEDEEEILKDFVQMNAQLLLHMRRNMFLQTRTCVLQKNTEVFL